MPIEGKNCEFNIMESFRLLANSCKLIASNHET